jgi:HEAT repeat protein
MRWKPTHAANRGQYDAAHDGGPTDRFRAVVASRSRSQLIASLEDPSPRVVGAAAQRLAELEGGRAGPVLREQLLRADLSAVTDIARALRGTGDRNAVDLAIAGLNDQRYPQRLAAALALGEFADPRAIPPLCASLADQIAGVRVAAIDALVRIGAPVGVADQCARLLADANPQVRVAAVRAVARLAPRLGEPLASVSGDHDPVVRIEVARHSSALPARAARSLLNDADFRVREAAVRAAGAREVGILAAMLVDDRSEAVRKTAARRLGSLGDPRVADVLVPGLEDPDAVVRAAVLRSLERLLARHPTIERLGHELRSDRAQRRRAIVYALARLNARDAGAQVRALVDDPDADVRLAVVQTADALLCDPWSAIHYLTTDGDPGVRHAAAVWLLRRRETADRHGGHRA